MKVITGITSCAARPAHVEAIRSTYFAKLPNPFFFRGEPGKPARREGDTIIVDCPDTYEHLPRKMWWLYEYLLRTEQFDYFLKLDDDGYVQTKLLDIFLTRLKGERKSLTHYMGSRILNPSIARSNTWHVGKVEDPAFSEAYRGVFNYSYCGGGTGYILSRRAMEVIVERGREHFLNHREIYEDKCHGDVLVPHGFLPTFMPSGMFQTDLSPLQIIERFKSRGRSREKKIQIGGSENRLLGWERCGPDFDATSPLPWKSESVRAMIVERFLGSLSPGEAWNFFKECRRVLVPNGNLRVTVPSISRIISRWTPRYLSQIAVEAEGEPSIEAAADKYFTSDEAKSTWTPESLESTLRALGFETREFAIGESDDPDLQNVETAGLVIGEEKHRLESFCIEARRPRANSPTGPKFADHRKVAFLFLTRDEPIHSEMWKEFLVHHQGEYSMVMHAKNPHLVHDPVWRRALIKEHLPTQWGNVSLVTATIAMLAVALRDPLNHKFILVSESCVPIKPFAQVRTEMLRDNLGRMSWERIGSVAKWHLEKAQRIMNAFRLPQEHCIFHHQWLAMNRETAHLVVEHDRTAHFENVFAADECYIASVLSSLGVDLNQHFAKEILTYANWSQNNRGHPKTFEGLSGGDIDTLRNSGCLFARKFSEKSNIRGLGMHLPLQ